MMNDFPEEVSGFDEMNNPPTQGYIADESVTSDENKNELQVQQRMRLGYCPTTKLIAEFFTKPLGDATFMEFRDVIMNL